MKDYETWSLWNKSFFLGLVLSLLWHLFWFFSITIVVVPEREKIKIRPRVVSLGPVLDDTIFKTLVETKPQFSETFYRQMSDFSTPLEPVIKKIERREPGDVVSVPMGQRFMTSMRGLVSGRKSEPVYEFVPRVMRESIPGAGVTIEGEARTRKVVSRPAKPSSSQVVPAFQNLAEIEIEFAVDALGSVTSTQIVSSSGDPEADQVWMQYLKGWQFAPLDLGGTSALQTGKARFNLPSQSRETND